MRTITRIAGLRAQVARWRRQGCRVGLVPTMGYLHAGHVRLIHEARRRVGRRGVVVVSIYVNPTQFGPSEDLARYPRDLVRDQALCRAAGVDVVFVPSDAEMYPGEGGGGYSTYVVEEALTRGLESVTRPTHFRGVTTIVAKLFNLVDPGVAVFGAKDFQQAAVVGRMARNLNFPVEIVVVPTVREADGLALSSRNSYLGPEERQQAVALWKAIQSARAAVRGAARPLPAGRLRARLVREIERHPAARVDYVAFVDPKTLEPARRVRSGTQLMLAVFLGRTRLIDNADL